VARAAAQIQKAPHSVDLGDVCAGIGEEMLRIPELGGPPGPGFASAASPGRAGCSGSAPRSPAAERFWAKTEAMSRRQGQSEGEDEGRQRDLRSRWPRRN